MSPWRVSTTTVGHLLHALGHRLHVDAGRKHEVAKAVLTE